MLTTLLYVLVGILIFAILAYGMKWVCDTFFVGIKLAYLICGVVLLIILILAASAYLGGSGYPAVPWHK